MGGLGDDKEKEWEVDKDVGHFKIVLTVICRAKTIRRPTIIFN